MKYDRFEDLPVWKDAARLYVAVEEAAGDASLDRHGDLRDQLLRAALSVSNNIAEGFERGSTPELIAFLYYARGSAGEVRSMLTVMRGSKRHAHMRDRLAEIAATAEGVSRQLRGWLNSLQNSDIKGQRRLNDATREAWDRRKRIAAFDEKLRRIVEEARRERGEGGEEPSGDG